MSLHTALMAVKTCSKAISALCLQAWEKSMLFRSHRYRQSLKKWLHVSSYSPKKGYFIAIFDADVLDTRKVKKHYWRVS